MLSHLQGLPPHPASRPTAHSINAQSPRLAGGPRISGGGKEQWGQGGQACLCILDAPLSLGLACLVCFILVTCFMRQSGSYWLKVFDNFAASLNLVTFAFLEVVRVVYLYGMER